MIPSLPGGESAGESLLEGVADPTSLAEVRNPPRAHSGSTPAAFIDATKAR